MHSVSLDVTVLDDRLSVIFGGLLAPFFLFLEVFQWLIVLR